MPDAMSEPDRDPRGPFRHRSVPLDGSQGPYDAPSEHRDSIEEALEPLRTDEQMAWIRDRFKPDGLRRLAQSTQDYYDQKGCYVPDVAALAYAEWERAEAAERAVATLTGERDKWRAVVEKVGTVEALRGLVNAAKSLCGKPEVIPGRIKLPPEFYQAALPSIQVLREAVTVAEGVLNDVPALSSSGVDEGERVVEDNDHLRDRLVAIANRDLDDRTISPAQAAYLIRAVDALRSITREGADILASPASASDRLGGATEETDR